MYRRTTIYIFAPAIAPDTRGAIEEIRWRIECYHRGGFGSENADIKAWLQRLSLSIPAERFEVHGPAAQAQLEAAVGDDTLLLESFDLTEAQWDTVITLATEAGFSAYDDRNRILH